MKLFALYVDDDRYSVPTLFTAELADDASATTLRRTYYASSPHYFAVEIWDGDRRVGKVHDLEDQDKL